MLPRLPEHIWSYRPHHWQVNVSSPSPNVASCFRQTVKNKSATYGTNCFRFLELVNFCFKLLLTTWLISEFWIWSIENYTCGGNNVADQSCFSLQICAQVPFVLIICQFMGVCCESLSLISESRNSAQLGLTLVHVMCLRVARPHLGRCGVMGSTLAFGSIGHGFKSEHTYFHTIVHQPSASWDHWRSAHWTIQFVDCCSSLS